MAKTLVALGLMAVMALRSLDSVRRESATFDEWMHLEHGIALLTRDPRFPVDLTDLINPPLARVLAAWGTRPAQWRECRWDFPPPQCPAERKWQERYRGFPFRYQVDSVALLRRARIATIVVSLLGVPCLMTLASHVGYPRAGPWAAFVYACCPNILAHGKLVTPDLPVTVACLFTLVAWLRLQRRPCGRRCLIAGLALGVALTTKYSAVLMLPTLALAPLLAKPRREALAWTVGAWAVAGVWVMCLYAVLVVPHLTQEAMAHAEHSHELVRFQGYARGTLGRWVVWPLALYRYGAVVAGRAVMKSFLVGHHSMDGSWSYFPIAVAVKTPLCELLACALGVGWALRRGRPDPALLWVASFPLAFLGVSSAKGIQVGLRHVLPTYPPMALLAGALVASWVENKRLRGMAMLLAAGLAVESATIHPHTLAFFNLGAGGPSRGFRYLVDCNLDWGQDLPALAAYQMRAGTGPLVLAYFGSDLPERYGVEYRILCHPPGTHQPPPGVYAVSATILQGLYQFPERLDEMAWFRTQKPSARAGYSILIYHVGTVPGAGGA